MTTHSTTQTQGSRQNRLASESSPYLLQHASNPVEWYPWGEEALARAREEDKPILLSIGYSACHWCHVMAHESFEDEATAKVMNELFVNVKVDREERPDLDKIYQLAQQMLTQRTGGWPLTMFLSPHDQRPFFGGTYFPNTSRFGMPAFTDLLKRVAEFVIASFGCLLISPTTVRSIVLTGAAFFQLSKNFLKRRLPEVLFTAGFQRKATLWTFVGDVAVSFQVLDEISNAVFAFCQLILTVDFGKPLQRFSHIA